MSGLDPDAEIDEQQWNNLVNRACTCFEISITSTKRNRTKFSSKILRNSRCLIHAAMRLRDKLAAVRVQAVKAVQRLQDPTGCANFRNSDIVGAQ